MPGFPPPGPRSISVFIVGKRNMVLRAKRPDMNQPQISATKIAVLPGPKKSLNLLVFVSSSARMG